MYMALRAPIVCAVIIGYIIYKYNREIHLNLRSTKIFNSLLIASLINLLLDVLTEYLVNIQTVNPTIMDILQSISLLSLFMSCHYIYEYMLSYIELNKEKQCVKERKINRIIGATAIVLIILLPIKYVSIEGVMCIDGPKVYALYGVISYLMLLEIIHLIKDKKSMPKEQYKSICLSASIFITVAVLQIIFPYFLISGMGLTLEVVVLYLSLESPEKYIDTEQKTFNINGLLYVLKEKSFLQQPEKLYLYAFNYADSEEHTYALRKYIYTLTNTAHLPLYKINENIFAIVNETNILKDMSLSITMHPVKIDNIDNIQNEIKSFMEDNLNKELYIDKMTNVFNRNKYEKDVKNKIKDKLWYVIADINNLKTTNDTLGHDKGDELIKDFAYLLKGVFTDECVYRLGGDEFVVISEKEVANKVEKLKEMVCKFNLEKNKNIDFAIGFEQYIENKTDWDDITKKADAKMYKNKKATKEQC